MYTATSRIRDITSSSIVGSEWAGLRPLINRGGVVYTHNYRNPRLSIFVLWDTMLCDNFIVLLFLLFCSCFVVVVVLFCFVFVFVFAEHIFVGRLFTNMVSIHYNNYTFHSLSRSFAYTIFSELRGCVKVEVAVLGSRP